MFKLFNMIYECRVRVATKPRLSGLVCTLNINNRSTHSWATQSKA